MQEANDKNEIIDASNLLRIAHEVMFVQLPEKYSEFSQMPAHVGIKKFGEEAISVMLTEYIQLDQGAVEGKPVIEPVYPKNVTAEQ